LARIIFWNVNKKDLTSFVCSITTSTNSDVVVLNENKVSSAETLQALQQDVSQAFYCPDAFSEERFHCFCRNPELDLSEIHSGLRTSVRKLRIGRHTALLALVHGVDIRNYDPETRQSFAQSLADDMRFVKEQQNTNKLILLGDFNMNPFESGMNQAAGLNAMMTKSCVKKGSRRHLGKDYDFYYNPMWSLFGDNTDGPAGTIYNTSNQGTYGWSMLDQVLINHSVVALFHDVRILTEAGTTSLMNNKGRPNANNASDHFPILVDFCGEKDE
jgi:exonuclease III